MQRKLGIFERAQLIANRHAPFNIISVLKLENPPEPDTVSRALEVLQQRHPLLRARVVNVGKTLLYEEISSPEIPFEVVERTAAELWQEVVPAEMAHRFDPESGPLFRAVYLYQAESAELVLTLHHAILDAISGMNLLEELLRLSAGEVSDLPELPLPPAPEDVFPAQYQGAGRYLKTAVFGLSQMLEMGAYLWATRKKRIPPVQLGGKSIIVTTRLPGTLVDTLSYQGRKKGITLSSMLNAAQLRALNQHVYGGQTVQMRTFAFADLRPFTEPPTPPVDLVNCIAMMSVTIGVDPQADFWAFAGDLNQKIYRALKKGDKFSSLLMSEGLLKMVTSLKAMRFGAAALNYHSSVPLKTTYGEIKLTGIHGFVSGYDLGPELASQARLFRDEIWWDFVYLDTDVDRELAEQITAETTGILKRVVE
jgi:hypothetical protein